jgi:hypothetical protein
VKTLNFVGFKTVTLFNPHHSFVYAMYIGNTKLDFMRFSRHLLAGSVQRQFEFKGTKSTDITPSVDSMSRSTTSTSNSEGPWFGILAVNRFIFRQSCQ